MRLCLVLAACCLVIPAVLILSAPAQPASAATPDQAAQIMVAKINAVRAHYGLPGFRVSPSLMRSSKQLSSDLMRSNRFAHRSRVSAGGGFRSLSECLAIHGGKRAAVAGTVRAWLRSPSHRRSVMTRTMPTVGVGMTRGHFGRQRAVIWVLQTGKR